MANDILIVRCKVCGEGAALSKYYPSTGFQNTNNIASFLDDHLDTCHEGPLISFGDNSPFELHSEGSWTKTFGKCDWWVKRRT